MPRLAVGNWKMNTDRDGAIALAAYLASGIKSKHLGDAIVGIAPPFCFLECVGQAIAGTAIELIAQDVHAEPKGAFTSAVSASMLASLQVKRVIVGHSERRKVFGDDDAKVAGKLRAVLGAGMDVILCVGEQLSEREAGQHQAVVEGQIKAALDGLSAEELARVVVAYEPVWAIGTGVTASPAQAGEMHEYIAKNLVPAGTPILYGGSVKPKNAQELAETPGIDGFLVGGASLKAESFLPIIDSCAANVSDSRS